jgi:hypothetical protein
LKSHFILARKSDGAKMLTHFEALNTFAGTYAQNLPRSLKRYFIQCFIRLVCTDCSKRTNEIKVKESLRLITKENSLCHGNRESYTKSDVNFKGKDYDFTVDMTAHDKPKGCMLIMFTEAAHENAQRHRQLSCHGTK